MTTAWALRHDPADQLSELEETLGGVSQKKESWHYDRAGNLASTVNVPAGQTGVLQMRTHIGRNQLTQLGGTGKTLVEGSTNEAATVKVNGQPAQVTKLGPSGPWRFQKEMDFPSGTTSITVEAKDGANNVRTNTYNVNVAASGAQTLEYDANGNLLKVRDSSNVVLRQYEWDASNRLLAIQIPGAVAAGTKRTEFVYDGAGRRVRQLDKEHNGTAWANQSHWYYLWDGLELAQKRDVSSGNVLANYFSNGEQQGANSLVYLSDHLGSPRSWYRVSDGAVGAADYSAYGVRTVTASGPGVTDRGYTGHLHHAVSGLALAPYRAYDPALGRWISEDPIEEEGGVNLYGYVKNSPMLDVDPLGLWQFSISGGYIGGAHLTIGNNGGSGGFVESLFNGQWNFGIKVGVAAGLSIGLDASDSGCRKAGASFGMNASGSIGAAVMGANASYDYDSNSSEGSLSYGGRFGNLGSNTNWTVDGAGRLVNPRQSFSGLNAGASLFAGIGLNYAGDLPGQHCIP